MKSLYNFFYIKIFFNPILIQIIVFILFYFTMIINGEVYYCDDGLNSSNGESSYNRVVVYENNTSSWENNYQNNYQNKEITYGYQTHDSDGRAIYQPYNEGLQSTSQGHRYELDGNTNNQESFIVEIEGSQFYAKYHASDDNGNHLYSYSSDGSTRIGFIEPNHSDGSTMIGVIEPNKAEVIGNGYYSGGPNWRIVDTSSTSFKRRCYNKVKTTISNHIAKSTQASTKERAMEADRYYRMRSMEKSMDASRKAKRYQDMYNGRPLKVVRKWD